MTTPDEYDGIREATQAVITHPAYPREDKVLSYVPSAEQIRRWTESLTGFEVNSTVSWEDEIHFVEIESLYHQSEPTLEQYATELGVLSLGNRDPPAVLFMATVRSLQEQHVGKSNFNSHKFDVLQGGRYSVAGASDQIQELLGKVGTESPSRRSTVQDQLQRDKQLVANLKSLYDDTCQVCGTRLQQHLMQGYSEVHHIQPLGQPHEGPDVSENMLVLCPNHHADFDNGMISVDPESLELTHQYDADISGQSLDVRNHHDVGETYLQYHNDEIAD